jgi:L,D-transpeptidase YcbB
MNMDVLGYNDGVPILRQRPGPGNALGQVKFVFPNSHSIYLHDTPMKPLFDRPNRTFSHGCIRISEPKKLAMWLLRNDSYWTEERIDAAMEAGKEHTVTLKNPVPVSIVYFTAFVDEKGRVNFRKDVYGRDTRLADMTISNDLK